MTIVGIFRIIIRVCHRLTTLGRARSEPPVNANTLRSRKYREKQRAAKAATVSNGGATPCNGNATPEALHATLRNVASVASSVALPEVVAAEALHRVAPAAGPSTLSLLKNLNHLKERESGKGGPGERGRIPLPPDWTPDATTMRFGIERLGDEAAVERCFAKFRVHHETSGEQNSPKRWQSRARGWVLKEEQFFGRQRSLPLLAPVRVTPSLPDATRHGWRPGLPTDDELRKKWGTHG